MTESWIVAYECTNTLVKSNERSTTAPEMIVPPATNESSATPRRSGSSKTNFAGGTCSWYVQIGQSLSYKFSAGVTLVSSRFASQYASIVPTSRQYGSGSSTFRMQLADKRCAWAR